MGTNSMRQRAWILAAVLVVVGGSLASILVARSITLNDESQSRQDFKETSDDIASTLQLAIQHEQDLVVSVGAYLSENRNSTVSEFRSWARAMDAFERYPEVDAFGASTIVHPDQIPAYMRRARKDPVGPILTKDGSFAPLPPGKRPFYCLSALGTTRPDIEEPPIGTDFCAGEAGPAILRSRDTGRQIYVPRRFLNVNALSISAPIYRGGSVPPTVEKRRKAFIGWVGTSTRPNVVLTRALQGHPGVSIAFEFRDTNTSAKFRSGKAPADAESVTTGLNNGWTVTTSGAVASGDLLENTNALALLIAGVVLSLVAGALIVVLATSRSRALRLVSEKTGELNFLAMHDALTELPNRALVMDRAAQMLARSERQPDGVAALFLDVDGFKDVNDKLGHAAGDLVLKTVAKRLSSVVRDEDTVGRLGGDEFVILLEGATSTAPPEMVAERVLEVLREPIEIEAQDETIEVSASIGIAVKRRGTADELLREADFALYAAKAAGKDRFTRFDSSLQSEADDQRTLRADLATALENEEFFLQYQPTFDLRDGSVVGVEALIRWQHPKRGVLMPDRFVPLAEESGLIAPIGTWVLHEACRQSAGWRRAGHEIGLAVNVSVVQLETGMLAEEVKKALDESGLPPSSLTLEITETALMRDVSESASRVDELKQLGVRIAIDDFGTGYSSLAYLQQFAIDALKIDQSFIAGLSTSDESAAIIRTLVQLGKELNIETLAEGIEQRDQLERVAREDVDQGQGFLYARPLDAESVGSFLEEHSDTRSTPRVTR